MFIKNIFKALNFHRRYEANSSDNLSTPRSLGITNWKLEIGNWKLEILTYLLVVTSFSALSTFAYFKLLPDQTSIEQQNEDRKQGLPSDRQVLASTTQELRGSLGINVPTNFNDNVFLKNDLEVTGSATFRNNVTIENSNLDLGTGTLTASNVLYSLTAGSGIGLTTGQTPTISNTGVLSLGGSVGALSLTAGSGISIDGLKISSSVTNPNTFKTITVGSDSFSAGSSTDTLELEAGTGITLATDTTNKKITITGVSVSGSGWTDGGTDIYLSTITDNVGIGTTTPSYKLDVAGTLNTSGAVTFGSTLGVTGNTTLSTLGTTGNTTVGGNFNTPGAATVGASLKVAGTATVSGSTVIAPTNDVTSLTVRAGTGATGNILDLTNTAGTTSYLSVANNGSLTIGGSTLTNAGLLESSGAIHLTNAANTIVGTAIAGGWTMNSNTFTYRRPITVTNTSGSTLPKNYQITVTLSSAISAHVYANTQTGSPYYDFRTAWDNSNSITEIARNVTSYTSGNVTYSFQLQSNISASGSDTYYIYYSNSALSTIDAAYSSYTGNVQLDSADAITNWASGDNTNYALTLETTVKNEGTGSIKAVGQTGTLGTLSTSGQGQLAAATRSAEVVTTSVNGTNYIYTMGGNTGSADINAVTKTTIDGSGNAGTPTATSQNALPQVLSGHTAIAKAGSSPSGGTGADGTLDLSLGSGAGGCNGTGLHWNAATQICSIVPATSGPSTATSITLASTSFQNAAGNQVISSFNGTVIYDRTNNTVSAGPALSDIRTGVLSFQNAAGNQVILKGQTTTGSTIYDRTNNTVSAGPELGVVASNGSSSFQNAAGNQVIVMGGGTTTKIYDRTNNTVSAGPDLGAAVSTGGFSFQNAAGNQVIVMGGATATTKIYDRTNNTVSAGTDLGANVYSGGFSFQNAAGNQVIALGGGSSSTLIYDVTNNTVSAGPDLQVPINSYAFSFQDSEGNQVILAGNGLSATSIYNRTTNTVSSGHSLGININSGAGSFANAAGNEVILAGDGTQSIIYNPKTTFNFTTVNIPSGKTLSASGGAFLTFNATGNVTVGGTISLDGKGYYAQGGTGKGGTGGIVGGVNYHGGGGAGFGGAGGNGAGASAGAGGSTYSTEDLGSGGGNGFRDILPYTGGSGGGGLKITSAGTISNSGTITADGGTSSGGGGGGSGGYINLTGNIVTNTGTISADGGTGGTGGSYILDQGSLGSTTYYYGGGGGGGGGIISLTAETVTQGTTTVAAGTGGAAGGGFLQASNGSAGTSSTAVAGGNIYVLGGINGATPQTTVYKSAIDTSSNVGAFSTTSQGQLPVALYNHSSLIASTSGTTYIYVIGGNNGSSDVTTVYRATLDGSNNIGSFATTGQGQLSTGLSLHSTVIASMSGTQTVYVIGGINGSTAQTAVLKSTIDASGNLGAFSASGQTALPAAIYDASAFTTTIGNTNYIYLVGGKNSAGNPVNTIYKGTIDASGNVTSWGQAGTVPATLSGTSSVTATTGTTNYLYVIGGNNVTPVSTVYRATVNDMSGYTATKTLTSSVNLSNKNHIQFDSYSNITGRYMVFEISEDNSSWTACADNSDFTSGQFNVSVANTWETKTCDISGVANASKDAILYLRFRVGTNQTSTITQYFDNIYAYMNVGTVTNSNAVGGAVLGSANLNLNAQGSGGVQLNYDAASGQAGSGGLRVYDGGIGLLFSVNTTGTASVSGGLTFTGASSSAQLNMLDGQNLTFKTSAGGDAGLTTRMTLLNSGQFGIGSGTPVGLFDVNGANTGKALVIFNETGGQNIIAASGSGTTRFVLTNGGLLGLGNSTPVGMLDVNGAVTGKALAILNETGGQNILTASGSGTTRLVLTNAGRLGLGTVSPLGMLDVLSNLGTVPIASFSGNTSFAGLVVNNNSTTGDLFTASSSGLNRFVIKNNGNITAGGTITGLTGLTSSGTITLSAFTSNGGVLYTNGSGILSQATAGIASQCLLGGTTPSFGACPNSDVWKILAGSIVPQNTTTDLLVGGASTASALFRVSGSDFAGTRSAASVSANTSFAGFVVDNSGTGDLFTASSSGLNRFVITQAGNVGIGTTTPGISSGAGRQYLTLQGTGATTNGTGVLQLTNINPGSANNGNIEWIDQGNSGSSSFRNAYITSGSEGASANNLGSYMSFATKADGVSGAGTERIRITNAGYVGISTATPSSLFQVGNQGDGSIATANSWNGFSDLRFKENVNTISDGLSKIMALNGVSFNWRNSGLPSIGFIAQEVEKVVPEIVNTDSNGFKSLDYGKITPLLVNAIHEQQNMISSLSAKLEKLETINFLPFSSIATDSSMITIKDSLLVLGSTTTNDLSVANTLSVGNSLNITGNSINTIGENLNIQSLKQGNISFMADLVVIDTQGNLRVSGNAEFAKDVKVAGVLSAQAVNITKDNYIELSNTEASSSASAGSSSIKAGEIIRKIYNPLVKTDSIISVTPETDTDNQVVFVSEKLEDQYFVVKIKNPSANDIKFNFLIINQK